MGTGSHRPQWETAKGRPDITGGIKHARSLNSHTKLKFRDSAAIQQIAKRVESTESKNDETQPTKDSDSTESNENAKYLLKQKELKEKLLRSTKPKAKWKTESAFHRKPRKTKESDIHKIVK